MALLVVVVLGVPQLAAAGQPSVSPPTGAGQTYYNGTYYFTGPYRFDTYISCNGGGSFSSSYSSFLPGTNVFSFYGAPDGSLLVSINGGGMQLVTSCGNPFVTPDTLVASYTVAVGSPPPPPTPTSTPTPTPSPNLTPPPSGGGPHGSGHTTQTPPPVVAPTGNASPSPTPAPTSTPTPSVTLSPSPTPSGPGQPSVGNIGPGDLSDQSPLPNPQIIRLAWQIAGLALALFTLFMIAFWRSRRIRERIRARFTTPRLMAQARWFNFKMWASHLIHKLFGLFKRKARGSELPRRRGFSAHHHSGKLLAHHHTSYASLVFLMVLAGIVAAAAGLVTHADSNLSLTVPGPPPTSGATIDSPLNGQHFSTNSVSVQGACPPGLLIEIYRNTIFAGSALCDTGGLYSVLITLVPGQNDLVARDADALGQYGPDSSTVSVYYDAPPPPSPPPAPTPTPPLPTMPAPTHAATPSPQPLTGSATPLPSSAPKPSTLLITSSQHLYQGTDPNTPVQWTITVSGGLTPYQLAWEWGDGSNDAYPSTAGGPLSHTHSYAKTGVYQLTVRATDASGHQAVIQLVTIVGGGQVQVFGQASPGDQSGNLILIWPLLTITGLVVLSFWLGEHHQSAADGPQYLPEPKVQSA